MNLKIKMQLRTNRKIKTTEFDDLGFEEKPIKSHKKSKSKISGEKGHSLNEVRNIRKTHLFYNFLKIVLKLFERK